MAVVKLQSVSVVIVMLIASRAVNPERGTDPDRIGRLVSLGHRWMVPYASLIRRKMRRDRRPLTPGFLAHIRAATVALIRAPQGYLDSPMKVAECLLDQDERRATSGGKVFRDLREFILLHGECL